MTLAVELSSQLSLPKQSLQQNLLLCCEGLSFDRTKCLLINAGLDKNLSERLISSLLNGEQISIECFQDIESISISVSQTTTLNQGPHNKSTIQSLNVTPLFLNYSLEISANPNCPSTLNVTVRWAPSEQSSGDTHLGTVYENHLRNLGLPVFAQAIMENLTKDNLINDLKFESEKCLFHFHQPAPLLQRPMRLSINNLKINTASSFIRCVQSAGGEQVFAGAIERWFNAQDNLSDNDLTMLAHYGISKVEVVTRSQQGSSKTPSVEDDLELTYLPYTEWSPDKDLLDPDASDSFLPVQEYDPEVDRDDNSNVDGQYAWMQFENTVERSPLEHEIVLYDVSCGTCKGFLEITIVPGRENNFDRAHVLLQIPGDGDQATLKEIAARFLRKLNNDTAVDSIDVSRGLQLEGSSHLWITN